MWRLFKDKIRGNNSKDQQEEIPKLTRSLEKNIRAMEDETVVFRAFESRYPDSRKFCIVFVDGMVNSEVINRDIIKPVMQADLNETRLGEHSLDTLMKHVIQCDDIKKSADVDQIIGAILLGDTVLLGEGEKETLIINTKGWEMRKVDEPDTERVVRGPREGFVESITVNLSLIRRRLRSKSLKFQFMEIGTRTKTKVCIGYIQDVASEEILEELVRRLQTIEIDGILDSGYVQELIKDEPLSPFKTVGNTERPDVAVARLLEGRIIVVCDGSPFVLTLPYVFMEYFQSNEDYYNNYIYSSMNGMIRFIGFFLSTSVPAIYVAVVTFHQEILQTPLLISVSAAREGVPLPTVVEALLMLFVFEVLREAGVRLPTPIGQTVSIVGALVLGEAAVTARFISAPMVIIIALTGISTFLTPKLIGPIVLTRLALIILSSVLGLYGMVFGVIALFIHLLSIRSFGVPYMLNLGAIQKEHIKDVSMRAPLWLMNYRPKLMAGKDLKRQRTKQEVERKS